jgi:hypothetical protein
MKKIKKFGVLQTAKVIALLYLVGSAIFLVPLSLLAMVTKSPELSSALQRTLGSSSAAFIISLPLLYGIFGFVFASVACLLYNFIASKIGGVAIEFDEE